MWNSFAVEIKRRLEAHSNRLWGCFSAFVHLCCSALQSSGGWEAFFYSLQSSEQTAAGIPGWSVLFLVIQVQEAPGQRGERSEQIWACCCFQIGWSNGWLLGTCLGCRLTLELSGPQEERLEAKGHRPVAREWPLTPTKTWEQRSEVMLMDDGCVVVHVHCCCIYLFSHKGKTVHLI